MHAAQVRGHSHDAPGHDLLHQGRLACTSKLKAPRPSAKNPNERGSAEGEATKFLPKEEMQGPTCNVFLAVFTCPQ